MVNALGLPRLSTDWYSRTQHNRLILLAAAAVLLSLGAAGALLRFGPLPAVGLVALLLAAIILWRPRIGLYLVYGLVLLLERDSQDPLMSGAHVLYQGIAGLVVTPLELLLLLTLLSWLIQGLVRHQLAFRRGALFWPVLLFVSALILGLVRGALAGGDLYIALWEIREPLYLVLCYFLAANFIRTRGQLAVLTGITLLAPTLLAIEGLYRRVALINTGQLTGDLAYEHEDVLFFGIVILLVLAQQVFGGPRWQRIVGPFLVPVVGMTMLASQRRAGYIGVIIALLVYGAIFALAHRKAFLLLTLPILAGSAIYMPLFWNNTGLLGQPARAIRSLSDPGDRDKASNGYRILERVNVRATIDSDPLLGVGFGREFLFVVPLPTLSHWMLWHYTPHHNILWVWLKTGAAGFTIFWVLIGTALVRGTQSVKLLERPEARSFALMVVGGTIAALAYCYVDTGLNSPRLEMVLGTTLGTLAVLNKLAD